MYCQHCGKLKKGFTDDIKAAAKVIVRNLKEFGLNVDQLHRGLTLLQRLEGEDDNKYEYDNNKLKIVVQRYINTLNEFKRVSRGLHETKQIMSEFINTIKPKG